MHNDLIKEIQKLSNPEKIQITPHLIKYVKI
jgi:hypothetical protein